MIIDLPNTSVSAVTRRIIETRENNGAMALGRVMTLIIVAEEETLESVLREAQDGTRQHPSRIVVVVPGNERGSDRLDAQLRIGGDAGASEMVILRLYGDLTKHGESVVMPLLLADSPIVAWWPRTAPENVAEDPLGRLAQRRITDAESQPVPIEALGVWATNYHPGDTDLVWTRTTRWRGILASMLDQPPYEEVRSATVTGNPLSASADLLAAWLQVSLDCPVTRIDEESQEGIYGVTLERPSGTLSLTRPDGVTAIMEQPGQPQRQIALPRRNDSECLADELSRMDADEPYEDALVKGLPNLTRRQPEPEPAE